MTVLKRWTYCVALDGFSLADPVARLHHALQL
jgi:hypothetical protein